mmetsp:Transcript_84174/g.132931  ORF Transcript_84174/g.132931 Transcript_84174/m.132931 type:complete len:198 (-) Transcript_84174:98-691(-)
MASVVPRSSMSSQGSLPGAPRAGERLQKLEEAMARLVKLGTHDILKEDLWKDVAQALPPDSRAKLSTARNVMAVKFAEEAHKLHEECMRARGVRDILSKADVFYSGGVTGATTENTADSVAQHPTVPLEVQMEAREQANEDLLRLLRSHLEKQNLANAAKQDENKLMRAELEECMQQLKKGAAQVIKESSAAPGGGA